MVIQLGGWEVETDLTGVSIGVDQVVVLGALVISALTPRLCVETEVGGQELLIVPHDLAVGVELLGVLLQVPEVLEHPGVCLTVSQVVDLLVVVSDGSRKNHEKPVWSKAITRTSSFSKSCVAVYR